MEPINDDTFALILRATHVPSGSHMTSLVTPMILGTVVDFPLYITLSSRPDTIEFIQSYYNATVVEHDSDFVKPLVVQVFI
jgi:hypothetical protein